MEKICFSSTYASIRVLNQIATLELEWHGEVSSAEFREGVTQALVNFDRHGCCYWLANMRKVSGVSPEDHLWFMEEWLPQFKNRYLKKVALIVPTDTTARGSALATLDGIGIIPEDTLFFAEREQALEWIALDFKPLGEYKMADNF